MPSHPWLWMGTRHVGYGPAHRRRRPGLSGYAQVKSKGEESSLRAFRSLNFGNSALNFACNRDHRKSDWNCGCALAQRVCPRQ